MGAVTCICEFPRYCAENDFKKFYFHTRNQPRSDADMDFTIAFPPPFIAFNSNIVLFKNDQNDRMTLRNVRGIYIGHTEDSPVKTVTFLCGDTDKGGKVQAYIFTVT